MKSKTGKEGCACGSCSLRFQCFTQKRVFSDPIFQGLFEALIAQGMIEEEALEVVTQELKARMTKPSTTDIPYTIPQYTTPQWQPSWTGDNTAGGPVRWEDGTVFYTMQDGRAVSWNAKL